MTERKSIVKQQPQQQPQKLHKQDFQQKHFQIFSRPRGLPRS